MQRCEADWEAKRLENDAFGRLPLPPVMHGDQVDVPVQGAL